MSKALPGEHYCEAHQGNHSHYAKKNCTVCRLEAEHKGIEVSKANQTQIGGDHYKVGGEEHWDRAYRLGYDPFQYIITKWIERWKNKGGVQDLYKAKHAIEKYIEVAEAEIRRVQAKKVGAEPLPKGYVNQD